MLFRAILVVIALWQTVDAYLPEFTVTCSADANGDPEYTVVITADGSATGIVFINGACASQFTAVIGTYKFNNGSCTPVPAFSSTFQLVFQENDNINLDTDYIVDVTCNPDTAVNATAIVTATGDITANDTVTQTLTPAFTVEIQEQGTNAVTTGGAVGDPVKLVIKIDTEWFDFKINFAKVFACDTGTYTVRYYDDVPVTVLDFVFGDKEVVVPVFGFTLDRLTVETAGVSPIALVTSGCSDNIKIIPHPLTGPTNGTALEVNFDLFVLNTGTPPIVPTTATAHTFTLTLGLCDITNPDCPPVVDGSFYVIPLHGWLGAAAVTAQSCSSRKRRSEQSMNMTNIELATGVVVLPRAGDVNTLTNRQDKVSAESDMCLPKAPFYGLVFALVISMLMCLLVAVCVFYRMRRQSPRKDTNPYDNTVMKGTY